MGDGLQLQAAAAFYCRTVHTWFPNERCTLTSLNTLKSLVREIAREEDISPTIELATSSVFLPHCLYKAAMVCLGDDRVSGGVGPELSVRPFKAILGCLGVRWVAAST